MPNNPITKERYEHFVNVFLAEGPNWNRVCRAMDCSQQTAKKAWSFGWPGIDWAIPIQIVYERRVNGKNDENPASVEGEKSTGTVFADADVERAVNPDDPNLAEPPKTVELVRMMGEREVRQMLDTAVMQVRANMAQALGAEQEMIGVARNNLKGILVVSDKLLAGLQPLVDAVSAKLTTMALATDVNPVKVLGYIDRLIKIQAATVTAASKLIEMQRLIVGAPQSITESRSVEKPAPTTGEAATDRAKLETLLEEAKRRALAAALPSEQVGEASVDTDDSTD